MFYRDFRIRIAWIVRLIMDIENNKSFQKQIDWLNVNLRREIQERLSAGARFSGTAWHLDQRIQKLEKFKLLSNRRHNFCLCLMFFLAMIVGIVLTTLYMH